MERHLITGATGFLGSWLALDLLATTDARVTCLVREQPGTDPTDRVRQTLHRAAVHHETVDPTEIDLRIDAVPGDVTSPDLINLCNTLGPVDEVWHSAASLKYRDSDVDEIQATNVVGARNIVELATKAGASTFNHISTAYVAGRSTGLILEATLAPDHPTFNQYERSKVTGESIVLATDLRTRIFRPSIVIGHSETFAAESSMGLFGFLRDMSRFVRGSSRSGKIPEIRLLAHPDSTLNFIPVDLVASAAVDISQSDSDAQVFHLTNGTPAHMGDALLTAARMLGLPDPIFTDDPDSLSPLDRRLNRFLAFYIPYLGGERVFDRTATDSIVGSRCDYPLPLPVLERLVQTWIDTHA